MITLKDADLNVLRFSALKGRYTTAGDVTSVDATEDELDRAYPGWWNKKFTAAEAANEEMWACAPEKGGAFVTVKVETYLDGCWNGESAYSYSPNKAGAFDSAMSKWAAAKRYELKVTEVSRGDSFRPVDNTNWFWV